MRRVTARLRLYSDFACPFCYIAEKTSLRRLLDEYDLELDWRGFELHPELPPGGTSLEMLFPPEKVEAMHEHLLQLAAHFGAHGMKLSLHVPNTRRILALAEVAREQGKLQELRDVAMDAHWLEQRDLEDERELYLIANTAGLSGDAVKLAATDPKYLQRVDEARSEAEEMGVTGIPTFILGNYGVVGCQPFSVLEQLAQAAGAKKRAEA